MTQPNILALAGSTRKDSLNKKLLAVAVNIARENGADVTVVDLVDFPMPLYDGDLEEAEGLPENADKLYQQFKASDGIMLASPEYNSSITAVLKNSIDWVSRPRAGEPPMAGFSGKTAGLMSASPGQLGGLRGLVHIRAILGNIGVHVVPEQVAVNGAHQAFTEDGALKDEKQLARLENLVKSLVTTTKRLSSD